MPKIQNDPKVYIYRLTSDTGLAPCVDNGLFSLAVCKGGQLRNGKPVNTGLRWRIGSENEYSTRPVFILGTYKDRLLYLAKVTKVVTMKDYFSGMSVGRTDDIYSYKDGVLERNQHLRKQEIHTETGRIIRDLAGEYVVLSDDYIYLGRDAADTDDIKDFFPKFQETKNYTGDIAVEIIAACEKHRDNKRHLPHEPLSPKCGG